MAGFRRPESVLVVVHTALGHVLLLERVHPPGFWQSVTGSLGWDETPQEAAVRELAEETGIEGVPVIDCRRTNRFPILPPWRHRFAPGVTENVEHVFRVELPQPVVVRLAPGEHRAWRWLPREAAARLASSWTDRDAIRNFVPAAAC
ncbi:dihydroneopterin triphosphate diphosphatase [Inmirania thermothiophila]|uniref:Dihydroneopterin triphosphate pyrophosphatase n=1 Tax=Inmirania thermothiophila TaxID=1750597 RepID=A0A3N1XU70_9GAMM|nr:dihydroneopterin triphosphate diphosphatase [Inmirania thermothiophila]ROR29808.1 dihydroneopterin triphosphate pyrophosphatase [Inmirania thermothiophila]